MKTVNCLSCGAEIELKGKIEIGQIVVCDACQAEFEIVSLNPLRIDWLFVDFDDEEGEEEYYEDDNEMDDEMYDDEEEGNW